MTSPGAPVSASRWASSTASPDFPEAVGPTTVIRGAVTAALRLGRCLSRRETGHAQGDGGRFGAVDLSGAHSARFGLPAVPGLACAGAAQGILLGLGIGDEVRFSALGDGHGDEVAGAGLRAARGDGEVDEPVVCRTPCETGGLGGFASGVCGDEKLLARADELSVLFSGDSVLQGDESLEALLDDFFGELLVELGGGVPGRGEYWNV